MSEVVKEGSIDNLYSIAKESAKEEWKHYNSKYINLSIDYPRQVSTVVNKVMCAPSNISTPVGVFVCNLLALKESFVLGYSRKNRVIPKQYNKRKLSCRKIIAAADWLVANGYAEEQRGRASSIEELRSSSTLWPTPKLLTLFENNIINYLAESYIVNNNPIILKDKNKKEIDYRDNNFTRDIKELMQTLNASNSLHVFKDSTGKVIDCSSLTRIFNEDWAYGGRLYRTEAQQIKNNGVEREESRLGITIDGMSVIEVDYCNLHAMLLCAIEGIHPDKFSGDMYKSVLSHANVPVKPIDRSLIKKSFSAMLNSESPRQAMQAIQGIINANGSGVYSFKSGAVVWNLIYHALPEFQKYFDAPDRIGMRLQRADSDMCCIVCSRFASKGLPIIPIHDSMLVLDRDGTELIQEMANAFKLVTQVGAHWPIFLKVESLYFPDELIVM